MAADGTHAPIAKTVRLGGKLPALKDAPHNEQDDNSGVFSTQKRGFSNHVPHFFVDFGFETVSEIHG